jgi:hypothetical protein
MSVHIDQHRHQAALELAARPVCAETTFKGPIRI